MNILIVDDSPSILALISGIVEDIGYKSLTAKSGEEAISIVTKLKKTPDLVILDMNMSGIDVYETAVALKTIAADFHLPIIFLTGSRAPDIQAKCLSIGDDYIAKPFGIEMIVIKIKAHLRVRLLTAKMHEQNIELKRRDQSVQNEHKIVERIFSDQFKKHLIQSPQINYHMSPVSVFNGDVLLTALGPTNNLYILIGDVTGHGLPAAVGATPIYTTFRTMAEKNSTIGNIAFELNKSLLQLLPSHMMMAAAIIEVNTQNNQLLVWSGGMPNLIIDDGEGNIKQLIHSMHPPLAAVDESEFSQNIEFYTVNDNDRIYIFTDGIQESRNNNDEFFGDERLLQIFDGTNKNIFQNILTALNKFTEKAPQDDDITLVEFRYQSNDNLLTSQHPISTQKIPLPWTMDFPLSIHDIQNAEPVNEIIRLLKNAKGIDVHQDFLSTILSELYNNALEYGLLKLDSSIKTDESGFIEYYQQRRSKLAQLTDGSIHIHIACRPDTNGGIIYIKVSDSGDGFTEKNLKDPGVKAHYGRGLILTKELCEKVDFLDQGRSIEASYRLQR